MGIGNWPRLLEQAYSALKPGGWIELQEFHIPLGCDDDTMAEGGAMFKWGEELKKAALKVGLDTTASLRHPEMLKDAGFEDVQAMQLKVPMGTWAKGKQEKKVGWMGGKDLHMGVEGISSKLLSILGYSPEGIKTFCEDVKAELETNKVHFSIDSFNNRLLTRAVDTCLHVLRCFLGAEASHDRDWLKGPLCSGWTFPRCSYFGLISSFRGDCGVPSWPLPAVVIHGIAPTGPRQYVCVFIQTKTMYLSASLWYASGGRCSAWLMQKSRRSSYATGSSTKSRTMVWETIVSRWAFEVVLVEYLV